MRVLVVTSWYPEKGRPLRGVFVREQMVALHQSSKKDIEAIVFYPFDEGIQLGELKKETEYGVLTYRANTLNTKKRYLGRLSSYLLSLRILGKLVKEYEPDLLHVHVGYPAAIITYLFTRNHRIPYVITEHMSYLRDYVDKWQHRFLLKLAFENAAYVMPVSPYLSKQIEAFGWQTQLCPLPNVVDTSRFKPSQQVLKVQEKDETQILFVGMLDETEIKGVQYLIPAFAEVIDKQSQRRAHLHLIGDGPKRTEYEKLAIQLGISEHCTFHGQVSQEELPSYFQQIDFLVLSSLKETFGVVMIEAMACGKPILATACGGPQSVVNDKVGMLVEPKSISSLVRGLEMMIRDHHQYDACVIREYVMENFSPEAFSKKLKNVYLKAEMEIKE